ncbi:MAG: nucleotide exchange factor GrpE [Akkermansia sp.]
MSKQKNPIPTDKEIPTSDDSTNNPNTTDPTLEQQDPTGAEAEADTEPTPGIEEELLKWRDTALRTAAEYDNYRKRMSKEKEDCARYANQRLLEELLPVIDNFEMGLQAASADTSSMIYIGMNMVKKQIDEFLTTQGVTEIPGNVGQAFDHNIHEALQREESDQPEGTILRVSRKGYKIKDRLLRPTNVVVAHHQDTETQEA